MNQCDGCLSGMPLNEHGVHVNPKTQELHMCCTSKKYVDPEIKREVEELQTQRNRLRNYKPGQPSYNEDGRRSPVGGDKD